MFYPTHISSSDRKIQCSLTVLHAGGPQLGDTRNKESQVTSDYYVQNHPWLSVYPSC